MQLRKILVRGPEVPDAAINFDAGANVVAGASDAGKSYLLHCLDYILGGKEMRKRIRESEPYAEVFAEFIGTGGKTVSLRRQLSGGELEAFDTPIDGIDGPGVPVVSSRKGLSKATDVTAVLFPLAGIPEAMLRKNGRGEVQRLTIRTLRPVFLVDEIAVIDERSPVTGAPGFDDTAQRRMLSFMLSGKDDQGVVATEKRDIVAARFRAQLSLITSLLEPLDARLNHYPSEDDEEAIDRVEAAIADLSLTLAFASEEHSTLQIARQTASDQLLRARSQLVAIDELRTRYELLDDRYASDLERLDFIAEGTHYFDGLQQVRCPLCDQMMGADHEHLELHDGVQASAQAEAAKILGYRADLAAATSSVQDIRQLREIERDGAAAALDAATRRMRELAPTVTETPGRLERLIARRVTLETARAERAQADSLRTIQAEIEQSAKGGRASTTDWEELPATALRNLCKEVEAVLKIWEWIGEGRVEFDQKPFDIVVDGQARQAYGKGVRGVLYAAFAIALLRYCVENRRPHPGLVIIDSPLTAYKKSQSGGDVQGALDAGIEAAFWASLPTVGRGGQIIIIENKEPPLEVARALHYEMFAGVLAAPDQRIGFFPPIQTAKP